MKGKKLLLLSLALIVPSCIFVLLKMFGRNQFDVAPLFTEQVSDITANCGLDYKLPYHIPDSVLATLTTGGDSLICVLMQTTETGTLNRVKEKYDREPVRWTNLNPVENSWLRRCIFMLPEPFDLVMVDGKGVIRGQYNSADRDDVDRLITEIAILLKKY